MKKAIIIVEGGIVQEVIHNIQDLDIIVFDKDVEGLSNQEFSFQFLSQEDKISEAVYQYKGQVEEYNPKRVDFILNQL